MKPRLLLTHGSFASALVLFAANGAAQTIFKSPVQFSGAPSPSLISTGDFDGDGLRDVVTVSGRFLYFTFGGSTGLRSTSQPLDAEAQVVGLRVADTDGNGKDDVVVARGGNLRLLRIRFSALNGVMQTCPAFSDSNIASGATQVVTARSVEPSSGTVSTAFVGLGPTGMRGRASQQVDSDNDGCGGYPGADGESETRVPNPVATFSGVFGGTSFVVVAADENFIYTYTGATTDNNGSPNKVQFAPPQAFNLSLNFGLSNGSPARPGALAALDAATLLVMDRASGLVYSLISNPGTGSFTKGTAILGVTNQTAMTVADVTGDGRPDIVLGTTTGIAILDNRGDGTFAPARVKNFGVTVTQLAVAQGTGDARPDIVAATPTSPIIFEASDAVPPGAFNLLAPSGTDPVAAQSTLDWSDAPGAVVYRVEIASEPSFAAPRLVTTDSTVSSFALPANLPTGQSLYWRVFAAGADGAEVAASNAPLAFSIAGGPPAPIDRVDIDANGTVNASDLARLLEVYGKKTRGCKTNCDQVAAADIDQNGTVDAADLILFLTTFGFDYRNETDSSWRDDMGSLYQSQVQPEVFEDQPQLRKPGVFKSQLKALTDAGLNAIKNRAAAQQSAAAALSKLETAIDKSGASFDKAASGTISRLEGLVRKGVTNPGKYQSEADKGAASVSSSAAKALTSADKAIASTLASLRKKNEPDLTDSFTEAAAQQRARIEPLRDSAVARIQDRLAAILATIGAP